jgi:hypothetical protein
MDGDTDVSCSNALLCHLKNGTILKLFNFLYRLSEDGKMSGRNVQEAIVYTNITLVGILLVLLFRCMSTVF